MPYSKPPVAFEIKDFSFGCENAGGPGDTFNFQPHDSFVFEGTDGGNVGKEMDRTSVPLCQPTSGGSKGDGTIDGLAVDPNNPNTEVDGRDFLVWQRGHGTPGPDDNLGLPAVQTDDGLLLPAVQTDNGLLLPAVQDDGLLLPAVQTDLQEWPIGPIPEVPDDGLLLPAVQTDAGLLLPY